MSKPKKKRTKKPPAIPPPEIIPLGDGMVAQVTDYSFEIYDADFNLILRISEDDGFICATASNGSRSDLNPDFLSKFAERLWHWARAAETAAYLENNGAEQDIWKGKQPNSPEK